MKTRFASAVVTILLLAACSSTEEAGTPKTTEEPAQEATTSAPAEEVTAEADDMAACKIVVGNMEEGDALKDIPGLLADFPETMDDESGQPYLRINDTLSRAMLLASPETRTAIESVRKPFKDVADVFSGGGGELNLDTSKMAQRITELMEICVNEGYQIDASAVESAPEDVAPIPDEGEAALAAAEDYLDLMAFSKKGLMDQLTSEYGGQFPDDAAKYAVENVGADWKEQALRSAQDYMAMMPMSKKALHDQLTSEYGGQFTKKQADYAIDNLDD